MGLRQPYIRGMKPHKLQVPQEQAPIDAEQIRKQAGQFWSELGVESVLQGCAITISGSKLSFLGKLPGKGFHGCAKILERLERV